MAHVGRHSLDRIFNNFLLYIKLGDVGRACTDLMNYQVIIVYSNIYLYISPMIKWMKMIKYNIITLIIKVHPLPYQFIDIHCLASCVFLGSWFWLLKVYLPEYKLYRTRYHHHDTALTVLPEQHMNIPGTRCSTLGRTQPWKWPWLVFATFDWLAEWADQQTPCHKTRPRNDKLPGHPPITPWPLSVLYFHEHIIFIY